MFGFGVEYWLATDRWSLLWHDDPLNCGTVHDPQRCKGDDKETRVPDAWLLIIWLGVGFAVFCADRFNQSRLRQRTAFAPTEG
jgi:hypothetical protein